MSSYSGVLKNVQQIGVRFHHVTTRIRSYFEILQGLYKLGYKVTVKIQDVQESHLNADYSKSEARNHPEVSQMFADLKMELLLFSVHPR